MNAITDERIKEIFDTSYTELIEKWKNNEGGTHVVEFARAIIKEITQ